MRRGGTTGARRVAAVVWSLALALAGAVTPAAADAPAGTAGGAGAAAPPVEVEGTVEPGEVTIGTRFRYTLAVVTSPDAEVVLTQPAERLGDFEIVDFGDEPPAARDDGRTLVTRWYTLVGFAVGDHVITSPPVLFRAPGEPLTEAPADDVLVRVVSLLDESASDIRDIKGPEAFPVDWRPYLWAGGALLALLALGALAYRLLNRPAAAARTPPPPPPHEVARAALAALRARRLTEQGAFKEYYSQLTAIVRRYLEDRYRVRAPEMTTEEFLQATARGGVLLPAHRALLADFLRESDLVKFARHLPALDDAARAWDAATRFVDETAPGAESTAVTAPGALAARAAAGRGEHHAAR